MNKYEQFEKYWQQAVNGLADRINTNTNPVLTQSQVQAIWREELLDKRFRSTGVKHGARVFLEELEKEDPETAAMVLQELERSQMSISIDGPAMVGKAAVAVAGLAAAATEKLHAVTRVASLLVGGTFTAKTIQDALQGTKGNLMEAMERESKKQLNRYKSIFATETVSDS